VRERAPDLIVVCGMVELLRRPVYSIPTLGAINLHPSLLPRYRGPDPLFWAYHDMDLAGGATVHLLDDGADTGDILFQEAFRIPLGAPRGQTAGQAMGLIGPRLMFKAMDALVRGDCPRRPQPAASPTVRARRVKLDEYRRLIGWDSWPIERVWHFLRGTEPWLAALDPPPGWRSRLGWSVGECEPGRSPGGPPGSIVRDAQGHCISLPQGRIRLTVGYPRAGLGRTVLGLSRLAGRRDPVRAVARPGNPS
jgi:methionyl-tRNA formyltransferase